MYLYICTGAAVVAVEVVEVAAAAAEEKEEEKKEAAAAQSHFIERISFSFIVTTTVRYKGEIYRSRRNL